MAEESRWKRIVAEKIFHLQEQELKEKVAAREERIMSRDITQLSHIAQRFYELKQKQILQALEQEVEGDKE